MGGVIVIAGLSNSYTDYTTTYEEYQAQRYESASTIYGPHQLNAYIQEYSRLAEGMAAGHVDPGVPPVDFSSKLFDTGPNITTDNLPEGAKHFGQVLVDAHAEYKYGDVVFVSFAGANALNNMRTQSTFLEVQRCLDDTCSKTQIVAVDSDWSTKIHINKTKIGFLEKARIWEITWDTTDVLPGQYRIVHYGTSYKEPLIGHPKFTDYTGVSRVFKVI